MARIDIPFKTNNLITPEQIAEQFRAIMAEQNRAQEAGNLVEEFADLKTNLAGLDANIGDYLTQEKAEQRRHTGEWSGPHAKDQSPNGLTNDEIISLQIAIRNSLEIFQSPDQDFNAMGKEEKDAWVDLEIELGIEPLINWFNLFVPDPTDSQMCEEPLAQLRQNKERISLFSGESAPLFIYRTKENPAKTR